MCQCQTAQFATALTTRRRSLEKVCRSDRRKKRGAAVVEFAIVAPLFILLVFGMIEFGRMVMVQQVLTNASREGARLAVLARLCRSGVVPFPSAGWRAAVDRIPVALRFGAGMLVVQGLASAIVGASVRSGEPSLQILVWPMATGLVVMAVLLPSPRTVWHRRRPDPSEGDSTGD